MVAGKDAETAGIIWNRLVKTKFGGKIGDRVFDGNARSGFSVSILAPQIFFECLEDLLQFAEKSFVL
jgi:hypothetical protein